MADALSQYPCKGEDTEVDIPVVVAATRPVNHPPVSSDKDGDGPISWRDWQNTGYCLPKEWCPSRGQSACLPFGC